MCTRNFDKSEIATRRNMDEKSWCVETHMRSCGGQAPTLSKSKSNNQKVKQGNNTHQSEVFNLQYLIFLGVHPALSEPDRQCHQAYQ